jgi:hypothetical protein
MSDWDEIRQKIKTKDMKHNSWLSDQKHLLEIIDEAQELGIDPTDITKASISNLRTIVKAARQAIMGSDKAKLVDIFKAAATLPTSQLRVYVGAHEKEVITYQEVFIKDRKYIQLFLTQKQYDRLPISFKARYDFIEQNSK